MGSRPSSPSLAFSSNRPAGPSSVSHGPWISRAFAPISVATASRPSSPVGCGLAREVPVPCSPRLKVSP